MAKKTSPDGSFAGTLAEVAEKYGLKIGALSAVAEDVIGLPTGNLTIDHLTGVNGLPGRRSTELYGPPGSGKTTTALQTAAQLQSKIKYSDSEDRILYLDFEHALDCDYAAALGLDVEHPSFLLARPGNMEQGCEAALALIATGMVRMVVFDSVASMAPLARLEGDFDQRTAAMNKARLMSGLMLQLTPLLHKYDCAAVLINHVYESIDMNARPGMPPREDTPGGRGLKYYCSLRISFKQIKTIHGKVDDAILNEVDERAPIATLTRVRIAKNKVGNPSGEAEVRITYGKGFDNVWSALRILVAYKKVTNAGAWFYFDKQDGLSDDDMTLSATGRPCIQGEGNVLHFAEEHPLWRHALVTAARDALDEHADAA